MSKDRKLYKLNRQMGMSKMNAGLAAGFPMSMISRRGIESPAPFDFVTLFEQRCMTRKKKVDHIIEGLNALKVSVDKDGNEHSSPDWNARYKYTELMLKLCKELDVKDAKESATDNLVQLLKDARERVNKEALSRIINVEVSRV
jgi:hypothetical protein